MRNYVQSAKDAQEVAEALYDFQLAEYDAGKIAYSVVQAQYALYSEAYDNYWCWHDSAAASEEPGHIPYTCPVVSEFQWLPEVS